MRFRAVAGVGVLLALVGCGAQTQADLHPVVVAALGRGTISDKGPVLPRFPERPIRAEVARGLNPDLENPTGRLIEVSITDQRFTAWEDGVAVMSGLVSTGMPGYDTPLGRYHVIYKDPKAGSAKWGVWMPWALNFHGNYFIHQLTHYPDSTVNIGASRLGTPASHGCVRVGIPNAEHLYRWARVGTPVWIH
jgi:lipoprotein-anchoring transpeptidase ErfK/SrfK